MDFFRDIVAGENNDLKLWDTLEDVMKITVSRVKTNESISLDIKKGGTALI